jgi:hypothetical protein
LPPANALELATIKAATVMSSTASDNMVRARPGMDAFDNKAIAEIKLTVPAKMVMPPKTTRATTKVDFLNTD